MRESEIKSGESYLFTGSSIEHRKFMNGTIVTVCGRKSGSVRTRQDCNGMTFTGRTPKRFKLTNGQYANAGNLKALPQPEPLAHKEGNDG